jgi:hypothetical protein
MRSSLERFLSFVLQDFTCVLYVGSMGETTTPSAPKHTPSPHHLVSGAHLCRHLISDSPDFDRVVIGGIGGIGHFLFQKKRQRKQKPNRPKAESWLFHLCHLYRPLSDSDLRGIGTTWSPIPIAVMTAMSMNRVPGVPGVLGVPGIWPSACLGEPVCDSRGAIIPRRQRTDAPISSLR